MQLFQNNQQRRKGFLQEERSQKGVYKQCHRKNNARQTNYWEKIDPEI